MPKQTICKVIQEEEYQNDFVKACQFQKS